MSTVERLVVIVLFEGVDLLDVTGPPEVFSLAQRETADVTGYRVALAAETMDPVTTSAGVRILPRRHLPRGVHEKHRHPVGAGLGRSRQPTACTRPHRPRSGRLGEDTRRQDTKGRIRLRRGTHPRRRRTARRQACHHPLVDRAAARRRAPDDRSRRRADLHPRRRRVDRSGNQRLPRPVARPRRRRLRRGHGAARRPAARDVPETAEWTESVQRSPSNPSPRHSASKIAATTSCATSAQSSASRTSPPMSTSASGNSPGSSRPNSA